MIDRQIDNIHVYTYTYTYIHTHIHTDIGEDANVSVAPKKKRKKKKAREAKGENPPALEVSVSGAAFGGVDAAEEAVGGRRGHALRPLSLPSASPRTLGVRVSRTLGVRVSGCLFGEPDPALLVSAQVRVRYVCMYVCVYLCMCMYGAGAGS